MNNVNASQVWDATVSVNLSGTFHLTQLAMKYLVDVPLSEDGERGGNHHGIQLGCRQCMISSFL